MGLGADSGFYKALPNIQGCLAVAETTHAWRSLLGFGGATEKAYLSHRSSVALPIQQASALLAVLLYLGYFVIELSLQPGLLSTLVWQPIVLVLAPACVLYWALLLTPWGQSHNLKLSMVITMTNAIGVALTSRLYYQYGLPFPPEAPLIQQFFNTVLMGLPLTLAVPVTCASLVAYVCLHWGLHDPAFIARIFMLTGGALVGLLSAALQERDQRLSWLRAQLLKDLSEHDPLTGLVNHRVYYQRGETLLRQARRAGRPIALVLLDIDHFKAYNDDFGHPAGDECLRAIATVLQQVNQRPLDMAARPGGEEFALVLYDTGPQAAQALAERLRITISKLALVRQVTASFGVASSRQLMPEQGMDALVQMADTAMYQAKQAGRNCVVLAS